MGAFVTLPQFFSVLGGDKQLRVIASIPCPFPGALKYHFQLKSEMQNNTDRFVILESKELKYDLTEQSTSSFSFTELINDKVYKVCLAKVESLEKLCRSHRSDCQRTFHDNCIYRETKCLAMVKPEPEMFPIQMKWSNNPDSLNPFQSIRVLLKANTFDGSKSGIYKYTIQCLDRKVKSEKSSSGSVSYKKNMTLSLQKLNADTEYRIVVTAHGCMDQRVSTEPIKVSFICK